MIRHYKSMTTRTAHYYVYGDADTCTHRWLALHGYGQLARNLAGKFDHLASDKHYVVAPEGLSRFYWEGVRGQVVASWMTSLDRLDEIADQITYLDRIAGIAGISRSATARRIVLGFSQGCATAWRWLVNSQPPVDTLIMWSGWLPEDIDYQAHLPYLRGIRLVGVHGNNDPYYEGGRFDILLERYRQAGLEPEWVRHPGGHEIDRDVLTSVAAML
ncbi:MAG: hypothetical protein R3301_19755 [Saprospiraceae bacterium]|nr:hypothetical protein [Saprospiraceae bacterium]